jgi:hypothetical protein
LEIINPESKTQELRPPPKPEVSKKKIALVIIIGIILILSFTTWFFVFRTVRLEQLAIQYYSPGDEVKVGGIITDIEKHNTSYGPLTLLTLDESFVSEMYKIVVDNDIEYKIGDWFQTTFHFEEYDFNGNKIITAKELYLSYMLPISIGVVMDAVSFLGGFRLIPLSNDSTGATYYEVFMRNGDEYPLDRFNVSIKKGQSFTNGSADHRTFPALFAYEYLSLSGDYRDSETLDFMDSLEDSVSQNGTMEFIDVNSNGLLDDHDKLKLNLPPTKDEFSIETYCISIGGASHEDRGFAWGREYLINWHNGPYEWFEINNIGLKHVSSEVNGTQANETLIISNMLDYGIIPVSDHDYLIRFKNPKSTSLGSYRVNVSKGIVHIVDNVYIEYNDTNDNSALDVNDVFIISGLDNQTAIEFNIFRAKDADTVGLISLVAGYGHIIGLLPDIELENAGLVQGTTNLYRVNVTTSYWHPQLMVNSTLRLLITNNSSEFEPFDIPLQIGVTQSFNGTNVTFFDADGDTYLSTGDYFEIECRSDDRYHFKLFMFKMLFRSISFNT